MRQRRIHVTLAAILMLLAACGGEAPVTTTAEPPRAQLPQPPSVEEARAAIESSPSFGEFEFTNAGYSLPVTGSTMNEPARATARELSKAGWIALDGGGDVVLTDRSRDDKRFLLRPNGILDIVPLAKKEMGAVEAVRQNDDGLVEADFTWRWIANEVGSSFETGPVAARFAATHPATATLMWNGTEWTVLKIERRGL